MLKKYIHGTTSAILPFLPKSRFEIISLNRMLFEHGYAPMSGEIYRGGVSGILDEVTTAFADIDSTH